MGYVVVGANGFIGSHLTQHFLKCGIGVEAGPSTDALQDGTQNWKKDWLDQTLRKISTADPQVVIIAGACQRSDDGLEAIEDIVFSNITAPAAIASELNRFGAGRKLVVFGSAWQMADSDTYRPFNLYAASKQACEDVLFHYALNGLKIASLRLFDTFGETDNRRKVLNILKEAALSATPIDVTPGHQEIDLIHIDDVTRAVAQTIEDLDDHDPQSGVLIRGVGSGAPLTIRELVKRIESDEGLKIPANFGGRPYRDREVMRTWRKFSPPTNWSPTNKKYSKFE